MAMRGVRVIMCVRPLVLYSDRREKNGKVSMPESESL